ncbi:MAG: glycosyltransferase [Elainella sp. Prado103]|jgi:ceramide glucosyltransferase|nr:glycosyltransferase [Elainella sp. Prado103]
MVTSSAFLFTLSFSLIALMILSLGVWLYGSALWAAFDYQLHASPEIDHEFHPKLSLLLPLHDLGDQGLVNRNRDNQGETLHPDLYANLRSFCQQDYPHYQIIFAVSSTDFAALEVVQQLMQQFPEQEIQLVVSEQKMTCLARTPLLSQAMAAAQYGLLVVSAPEIRVGADYLQQMVQPFRYPGIGLVSCPLRSQADQWAVTHCITDRRITDRRITDRRMNWVTWGNRLEALMTATIWHPLMLMDRRSAHLQLPVGDTFAIRRDVLLLLGGFEAITPESTIDCSLGSQLAQIGYRALLSPYVVEIQLRPASLQQVWQHQLQSLKGLTDRSRLYYGMITSLPLLGLGLGLELGLGLGCGELGWFCGLSLWSLRFGLAFGVGRGCLQEPALQRNWWLLPIADLLSFSICCTSWRPSLSWRQSWLLHTDDGLELHRSRLYASSLLPDLPDLLPETVLDEL